MSLALTSKLAKLNQTRYPFLARELRARFFTSAATMSNVPKANTLSLSVVFRAERTNDKPQIVPLN